MPVIAEIIKTLAFNLKFSCINFLKPNKDKIIRETNLVRPIAVMKKAKNMCWFFLDPTF